MLLSVLPERRRTGPLELRTYLCHFHTLPRRDHRFELAVRRVRAGSDAAASKARSDEAKLCGDIADRVILRTLGVGSVCAFVGNESRREEGRRLGEFD